MNKTLIDKIKSMAPKTVIVMASKYLEADGFYPFIQAGIKDFGENRDDAFLMKAEALKKEAIHWHFIGTLQTKKVKKMINQIEYLHTLDRLKLADEIEKRREKPLKCFIQVNISDEPQKHGIKPSEVHAFYDHLKNYQKIDVIGLMGMAKDTNDQTVIKRQFETLKTLQTSLNLPAVSMGMSQDYLVALEVGTTHLRLGRILLEES